MFLKIFKHKIPEKSNIKVLVYTDSRAQNVTKKKFFHTYVDKLSKRFYVTSRICPKKWTTTLDFLGFYSKLKQRDFDLIILQTGIVDWSPRHQKIAKRIYYDKKRLFLDVFPKSSIEKYINTDFGVDYEGDKTINMYSLEMAEKYLIPLLRKIPNLIYINSNRILSKWNGNYWKQRPINMYITHAYSRSFAENLDTLDLLGWSNRDIRGYTFDNIHLNQKGNDYIYNKLIMKIK